MSSISSGGHRGSVAAARAPLGCGSVRSGIENNGGGVAFFLFIGIRFVDYTPGSSTRSSHTYSADPQVGTVRATSHCADTRGDPDPIVVVIFIADFGRAGG